MTIIITTQVALSLTMTDTSNNTSGIIDSSIEETLWRQGMKCKMTEELQLEINILQQNYMAAKKEVDDTPENLMMQCKLEVCNDLLVKYHTWYNRELLTFHQVQYDNAFCNLKKIEPKCQKNNAMVNDTTEQAIQDDNSANATDTTEPQENIFHG